MTLTEMQDIVNNKTAVMFYFSTKSCNVCKVLKPKILSIIENKFPQMNFIYIDTEEHPDIAAQNLIFSVPTITVFFNGKESIRKARFMGVEELASEIKRPYSILFNE